LVYLTDENPMILQESIANTLKRIVKYEKPELKNRVTRLLRIRWRVSKNQILNDALAELLD
jgi:hypothetical protein